jgi:hypothetical protein
MLICIEDPLERVGHLFLSLWIVDDDGHRRPLAHVLAVVRPATFHAAQ